MVQRCACAAANDDGVHGDIVQVRHITQKVAEKARRIEERRRDVDERLSVQEPIEREEIPLVERVSEGRYLIGGRIYFVRVRINFWHYTCTVC